MKNLRFSPFLLVFAFIASTGCGKDSSFSLLSDADSFKQTDGTANAKVDILWIIDNSGSMRTSQQDVADNLDAFIEDFAKTELNFKMAVAATDSYKSLFSGSPVCARFRDGIRNSQCNVVSGMTYSGIYVLDFLTPNLQSVFLTNAVLTGTSSSQWGSGDERAFQSIKAALDSSLNDGFLREDSFLSIIIVSDEEDFSHNGSGINESYSNPGLHTVQSYVDYLDEKTGSTPTNRRYNVNAMAVLDSACWSTFPVNPTTGNREQKISTRYPALVDAVNTAFPYEETRGIKSSLCGNFSEELKDIADGILSLANTFTLARIPIPETIVVKVNGEIMPHRDENPLGDGGWVYQAESNSILFTPKYIPVAGSSINVTYDPVGYGQ